MNPFSRKLLLIVALVLLTALAFPSPTPGQAVSTAEPPTPAGDFKAGELLVKFETGMTLNATENLLNRYQATQIRALYRSDVQLWSVPAGRELEIVTALNANPVVVYAEPNYLYHAFDTTPDDPYFSEQWAHTKIQSPAAWDITTGSDAITIAIIDTGIDEGHPDLASKIVAGYDYVDSDSDPHDLNGHGTHCAGIAAAITDNSTGVAGTSWGAKIMPLRVLGVEGSGYSSDITDGITWAYTHGADVLSLSLGGTASSTSMQNAINAAHAAGSLVVAAMGNDRTGNPTLYPAANNNVMAVAATAPDDTYAYYSQYGSHCDISAPGGEMSDYHDSDGIYSTMPTYNVYMTTSYNYYKNYDYLKGTSQATPYVAGLAALVWSANPDLTPDEVQAIIEDSADDLGATGWDSTYGHGRINAFAALQAARLDAPGLSLINNPSHADVYLVNWSEVTDAIGYVLQEDDNTGFSSPQTRYSGQDSQYSVTGQREGTWYYRVRAQPSSSWSNVVFTTVASPPLLFPIVNSDEDGNYLVNWSDIGGVNHYILEESNSLYFVNPTEVYTGTDSEYAVSDHAGGTWYYRVCASSPGGNGSWSLPQSTTVAKHVYLPLILRNCITYFEGPWEVEPNNSVSEANGPLRSGQDYYGYPNDARDYFSLYLRNGGAITIDLTGHTGQGVQLQLFYQNTGNRVAGDMESPYHIDYTGPAGLYYIYIYTASDYNSTTPYTLRVTFPQ